MHVNLYAIKSLHRTNTVTWTINSKYIPQILKDLESSETTLKLLIDFSAIGALVEDLVKGKKLNIKFCVIPEWPCMGWYKPLHDQILAEAIKLPTHEDVFLCQVGSKTFPAGQFAWDHWLVELW